MFLGADVYNHFAMTGYPDRRGVGYPSAPPLSVILIELLAEPAHAAASGLGSDHPL